MSKKNKKKKFNKIMKEVERKRELGISSLINDNSMAGSLSGISEFVFPNTEKALSSFIDQWKNSNIRILLSSFFTDYMEKDYSITYYKTALFTTQKGIKKLTTLIDLKNNKDKDEKVSFYIYISNSDKEKEKEGKICFSVDRTLSYHDPKTKYLMENLTRGKVCVDEL